MTPQEKLTFEAMVKFRNYCARLIENYESPVSIFGGLFKNNKASTRQSEIANIIRGIDLSKFYLDQPTKLIRGDRVQVKQNAGFSRGSKGTVKYITPLDVIWVERDGSGSDMIFDRDELDLLV